MTKSLCTAEYFTPYTFTKSYNYVSQIRNFFKFVTYIKQRQAEGIKLTKEKGVMFGRPRVMTPANTKELTNDYINHLISNTKASKMISISRGTFFRLVRERKALNNE